MTTQPTLDKMLKCKDKSQMIGDFLDWLRDEKRYIITRHLSDEEYEADSNKYEWVNSSGDTCISHSLEKERLYPIQESWEELLAEYFGIDLKEAEKEKEAMLVKLRENGH